jgi:hypothetical protein
MFRKLQVVVILLCMLSYSAASTVSIGTACVRGDMRVDSAKVKGNATLFNGSVVETGDASADLRLDKGTEIRMATNSRATLYRDHAVLQQGESELAANDSFQLQANGLRVSGSEPSSRGVVSLRDPNTVEVAALTGSFGVTNGQGVLVASVHPGLPISFAMQAGGAVTTAFKAKGVLSTNNGNYYITTKNGTVYQVTGKDLAQYVGKTLQITGTATTTTTGATVITITSTSLLTVAGLTTTTLVLTVVGVAAGAGVGIAAAAGAFTPASR